MSAPLFRLFVVGIVSLCVVKGVNAAESVLHKVPALTVEQAPAYPENVARYHFGAQVEAAPQGNPASTLRLSSKTEDVNASEVALLCDDPTIGYALPSGSTSLLISLSKIENVDSVSCFNRGAKGEVVVSVSNVKLPLNSSQWRQVSQQDLTAESVKAKIGPSEAKYVKLTFNVSEPGRISGLGVYSTPTVAAFTMPRARSLYSQNRSDSFALINYNLTDVHARSRALYVSSGDDLRQANNMIDDQPDTTYAFAPNDAAPTAVVDLGKVTALRRISAVYSAKGGTIDFFVVQSLPGLQSKDGSTPKTLRLADGAFANMKRVGSVATGSGRAAVDFPQTTGRYIILKWTPASLPEGGFSVAEIAAFGGTKGNTLLAANEVAATGEEVESDGKTVQEGKDLGGGKDAKDIPAEGVDSPAEGPPPGLPDPPPFTFVPQLVPISP